MPHEPKKRHSRARQGKRRAAIHLVATPASTCPNCGNQKLSHIVCSHCGYYKGQQVIEKSTKPAETA